MRLIDAELLKRNCKCTGKFEDNFKGVDLLTLGSVVDNQPTAYDVDKVIEQLTENINSVETELANLKGVDQQILLAEREHLIGKKLAYATAIDIIRAGGKE